MTDYICSRRWLPVSDMQATEQIVSILLAATRWNVNYRDERVRARDRVRIFFLGWWWNNIRKCDVDWKYFAELRMIPNDKFIMAIAWEHGER